MCRDMGAHPLGWALCRVCLSPALRTSVLVVCRAQHTRTDEQREPGSPRGEARAQVSRVSAQSACLVAAA